MLNTPRDPNKVYPVIVAARMIHLEPRRLETKDIEFLDMLCRKIHITKTLSEYYDPDWRKSASAAPLPTRCWPIILAVLLFYPISRDEQYRGRTLKYLNAVYATFTILAGLDDDVSRVDRFKDWADYKLKEIIRE